jgi:hypothetical protein
MTQPTDVIAFADADVESCTPDTGRSGPQWKLGMTTPLSKFPDQKFWIDQSIAGSDPIQPGRYWAEFRREGKKKATDDGMQDWHYNWRLLTLWSQQPHPDDSPCPHLLKSQPTETDPQPDGVGWGAQPTPQPASRPTSRPAQDARSATQGAQAEYRQGGPQKQPAPRAVTGGSFADAETLKRASIHRQVALKAAVEYAQSATDWTTETVVAAAQTFLDFLNDKQPEPPEADAPEPEADSQDDEANPFDE